MLDGYGGKAGEGLTEEKTAGLGLPTGLRSMDRGRSREERGAPAGQYSEEEGAGRGTCWGRRAGFRFCGSLDFPPG